MHLRPRYAVYAPTPPIRCLCAYAPDTLYAYAPDTLCVYAPGTLSMRIRPRYAMSAAMRLRPRYPGCLCDRYAVCRTDSAGGGHAIRRVRYWRSGRYYQECPVLTQRMVLPGIMTYQRVAMVIVMTPTRAKRRMKK
eukprot:2869637-Rhodomonas_salina.1